MIDTGILDIIAGFLTANPKLWAIFTVIGILRLAIKPVVAFIDAYVTFSPGTGDNETWEKIKASTPWKVFVFVVDWLASVKLPKA